MAGNISKERSNNVNNLVAETIKEKATEILKVKAEAEDVIDLRNKMNEKVDKKEDFSLVKIWNTIEQVSLGKTNTYTWIEDEKGNVSSIPGQLSDFENDMNYAVSSTTLSGYGITDAYTKAKTNEYLAHKENVSNKVDLQVDAEYGDDEYPTAKSVLVAFYVLGKAIEGHDTQIGDINTAVSQLEVELIKDFVTQNSFEEEMEKKENVSNKTTEITMNSTDEQYPTARAVWDKAITLHQETFNNRENIDDHTDQISAINTSLDNKANKPIVSEDEGTLNLLVSFSEMENKILHSTVEELTFLSFKFNNTVYAEDYTAELSFNSGVTPTMVAYTDSGILNWLGTDCSLVDGLSIFAPTANKHYDVVFYFNGTCFVGLVNGFETATKYNTPIVGGGE